MELTTFISQNLFKYCTAKYSSSVVEILVNNINYESLQIILEAFFDKNTIYLQKNKNMFRDIMLNQYGNYAISTII
jgi:hypothetical protein